MATAMSYSKDAGPVRKKLKTSEIPISRETRKVIEDLAHKFKKKGGYDSLRKQVWDDLRNSDFEVKFTEDLTRIAEEEMEHRPDALLKPSRDKATVLLEGVVQRAGVYQNAEERIDRLIDAQIEKIESGIRALRRADVGEELAAAEEAKGGKTDEQYAEESRNKKEARERIRQEARDAEQAIVDEKRREERARRKEEERKLEAEREKRSADREARRKAEREREEEKARELRTREKEREREREKERERGRDRERQRDGGETHRRYDEDRNRRDSVRESKEVKDAIPSVELSKEEVERLEKEALDDLLKEGERISRQSRPRHQMELDIDEALAPPPRKTMPASAINPISRDSPVRSEMKKPFAPPTGPKAADTTFRTPAHRGDTIDEADARDRRRSRSRDRASRRSSRSRSRHSRHRRDSRDRDTLRSRRDSRDRDGRHRSSRDHDYKDDKRRRSRERTRDDRRKSYRSRSRSPDHEQEKREARARVRVIKSPPPRDSPLEHWKVTEAEKRAQEAKAYLAAQKEAAAKGIPFTGHIGHGRDSATPKPKDEGHPESPSSARKPEYGAPRRPRSGSRTDEPRRTSYSHKPRSTSPVNIDRYVPGTSSRARRDSTDLRSPTRKHRSRSRERDRDREKGSRRTRDEERTRYRSRSRSRSRRRERSRDRKGRSRSRSRSPYVRKERESRRERSRSRDKDRERRRERSRSRSRDRDRERERRRSRSRGSRRVSRRD